MELRFPTREERRENTMVQIETCYGTDEWVWEEDVETLFQEGYAVSLI